MKIIAYQSGENSQLWNTCCNSHLFLLNSIYFVWALFISSQLFHHSPTFSFLSTSSPSSSFVNVPILDISNRWKQNKPYKALPYLKISTGSKASCCNHQRRTKHWKMGGGLGLELPGKLFETTPSRLSEKGWTPILDVKTYWICLTPLKIPILLLLWENLEEHLFEKWGGPDPPFPPVGTPLVATTTNNSTQFDTQ